MFRFPLRPFSVLPAGGEGVGQAEETESTLALAENVYVNLPRPVTISDRPCVSVNISLVPMEPHVPEYSFGRIKRNLP